MMGYEARVPVALRAYTSPYLPQHKKKHALTQEYEEGMLHHLPNTLGDVILLKIDWKPIL